MPDPPVGSIPRPEEAGCVADESLAGSSRAIASLADAVETLTTRSAADRVVPGALRRGMFRPGEENELMRWFARLLTVRDGLWEVVEETSRPLESDISRIVDTFSWRCFVLGYSAACLVVRLDQFLVEEVATDSLTQRKLNEGSSAHRIPRKQFTAIFESFTDPQKALLIWDAMRYAKRHRDLMAAMVDDPIVGPHAAVLREREAVLNPSRRTYGSRLLRFLSHAWRRRSASGTQQALFAALETGGRVVSELHDHWSPPYVATNHLRELEDLLRPGDVLVTRHERALTNLFLPGYWPHAALFIGSAAQREELGVEIDDDRRRRWAGERCVLEALKDGVLFRSLDTTMAVDAVAVIRPRLEAPEIAEALARAVEHEGKGYNFDFDFFRSDRLVCTEVVYRAFDGVGQASIPLSERAGRPTLSAEDLLEMALAGKTFEPVAVCGASSCRDDLVTGDDAAPLIAATMQGEITCRHEPAARQTGSATRD